tara:strand:- start:68 stop:628 length:561 start_codon:yes stop_codon:yes gene_type:complete
MATEIIRPNGLVTNDSSVTRGLFNATGDVGQELDNIQNAIELLNDENTSTGILGITAQSSQIWLTLGNLSTAVNNINSVKVYVHAKTYKALTSQFKVLLSGPGGAVSAFYGNEENIQTGNISSWETFTDNTTNWSTDIINDMTVGIIWSVGATFIYEVYVEVNYQNSGTVKLSSGLIQLTSGKITL